MSKRKVRPIPVAKKGVKRYKTSFKSKQDEIHISAQGVTVRFGSVVALDNFSINIPKGI